jgi:molybdopterin-guanine dinucleotide biosynthesis protein MobB
MKVIQVVGRSNSGKTTLIKKMIPVLAQKGPVGVIKHLGDHTYSLAEGKDTTEFYSAGAAITVGIDAEKTVSTLRSTSLDDSLRILCENGIMYAVIEGFKTHPYPRIVIGDLPGPGCLLRNPSVREIIDNLASFPDYKPPVERDRKTKRRAL